MSEAVSNVEVADSQNMVLAVEDLYLRGTMHDIHARHLNDWTDRHFENL